MPVFEIEANGKTFEVEAPDAQTALSAIGSMGVPSAPPAQPDRLSVAEAGPAPTGDVPPGFVLNPETGQMVDMSSPHNPYVGSGAGRAAMQGLGQGVSFGGMDEVVSGAYGVTGPGSFGENRAWADAVMDEELRRARGDHPVITGGSEVAGGLATGILATSGVGPAATAWGKVGQAAGIGAGSGAVYGGLSTEGGVTDRAKGAALNGLIGAGIGAASVPVEYVLRKVGGTVVNAVRGMSGSVKPDLVETALAQALAGSGQSGDEVAAALRASANDGQGGIYALADALGDPGQRALSGASRLGGTARRVVTDTLDARQASQGERIAQSLADALDARATAPAARSAMTGARDATADIAYDAARKGAGPVDVRGAISVIDDRLSPMLGSGVKGDAIDAKLAGYRARLTSQPGGDAYPGSTSVDLSDFDRISGLKKLVQDDASAAYAAGRGNEGRELKKLVRELDGALEDASAGYRAANDGFARASREIDQIDAGANASRPSQRASDTVDEYGKLTPEQQAAYRTGYGDKVIGRVEAAAEGANKARPFTSGKSIDELATMARDPKKLARALDRENIMFETRRKAIGGSQTADNLADQSAIENIVERGISPTAWIKSAGSWISNMSKGQNEATRAALADALLSTGDEAQVNIAKSIIRGQKLTKDQNLALRTILYLNEGAAVEGYQVAK